MIHTSIGKPKKMKLLSFSTSEVTGKNRTKIYRCQISERRFSRNLQKLRKLAAPNHFERHKKMRCDPLDCLLNS